MLASHLVEIKELPPDKLCNYIDSKHYIVIRQLLESITLMLEELFDNSAAANETELVSILFFRLKDEVNQMLRNDTQVIFPLIKHPNQPASLPGAALPVSWMQRKHKTMMALMEKLRHSLNNYLARPSWSQDFRLCCDELLRLEQQLMQAIYIKENVLMPRCSKAIVKEKDQEY